METTGDFDGDGDLDLAVTHDSTVTILLNESDSVLVSAQSLEFSMPNGSSQAMDTLILTASRTGLSYSISVGSPWLNPVPDSGVLPDTVLIHVSAGDILAGNWYDTLVVSVPQTINSPIRVPVHLTLTNSEVSVHPFPVPASLNETSSVSFSLETTSDGELEVWCYNSALTEVSRMVAGVTLGHNEIPMDITDLSPGVYLFKWEARDAGGNLLEQDKGKFIVTP
jgi:hypothetical protein